MSFGTLKKYLNLVRIKYTTYGLVYVLEKIIKMENSLVPIFDEIWSKTKGYIALGHWPDYLATLKIWDKSKLDGNQLKLSTQHKYTYMYKK